ncbi:MAG: hypothetical protein DSZ05_05780 [Sulfurospirillum sp.]|nr:MAG: hypothetical protein DSZ05_05780 [Sulfurospirillum sp.]
MKRRVGILTPKTTLESCYAEIVEQLAKDPDIELILLHDRGAPKPSTLHEKSYRFLFGLEKKVLSKISSEVRTHTPDVDITGLFHTETILISGHYGTNSLTYSPKDLTAIQNAGLDLILHLDTEYPLAGEIVETGAKDGIVGMFTARKTAFWQTYRQEDSVSFSIEQYKKGNNRVLITGALNTMRFVTEMRVRLIRESGAFLIRFIRAYAKSGQLDFRTHPNPTLFDTEAPATPKVSQQLHYILNTGILFGKLIFKRVLLRQQSRFGVAFLWKNWEDAKLSQGVEIKTPDNHFYADPFVWKQENRVVCFLEDYDYTTHLACVTAVELFEDGSYTILGEVVKEPFHLSFPYLFTYENELYMIPESTASESIRLYKCTAFPMQWEYQYDLMKDVRAADTMLFPYEGRWWMLTNISTENNYDQAAQLYAFYSDSPLSTEWKPHRANPVAFSSAYGRNGGILFTREHIPVRGRQKQKFNIYGAAFSIAKIKELTPEKFCEETLAEIEPRFFPGIEATHHIHSHGDITVYDFMRQERVH